MVAMMMRVLNYVNMFNHGIGEVQDLLLANGNPEASFNISYLTAFSVIVRDPGEEIFSPLVRQLASSLSPQAKSLILSVKDSKKTSSDLQLVTNLSPKSKQLFRKQFIYPSVEAGLMAMTHPDNPRHPQQQYYLTELGLAVLKILMEE